MFGVLQSATTDRCISCQAYTGTRTEGDWDAYVLAGEVLCRFLVQKVTVLNTANTVLDSVAHSPIGVRMRCHVRVERCSGPDYGRELL